MEPASKIIELCGGFEAVAKMTGRSVIRVRCWTYPKEKGGTGGHIPAEVQSKLLEAANRNSISLTPNHFFPSFDKAYDENPPSDREDTA